MKAVELFAGIGGFRLGLERAGHEVVWSNEWDRYAADVYDKNFERIEGFHYVPIDRTDITAVDAGDIPDHDILCGGFPCQAFSVAGLRRGFSETRGTLFFEIARILEAKKPSYLLLENVKGLLSHDDGRTFQTIIGVLTGLGYRVQWCVLNSKDFGVPQNRERVFIVGHLRGLSRPQVFLTRGDRPKDHGEAPSQTTNTLTASYGKGPAADRPLIALTPPGLSAGERIYSPEGISPTLASGAGGGGAKTGLYAVDYKHLNSETRRGRVKDGYVGAIETNPQTAISRIPLKHLDRNQKNFDGDYAYTVDTHQTGGVKLGTAIRRLTPVECERLQGFPDGWTEGVSDTQRYKQLGNAVTVNVVEFIAKRLPR